VFRVGLAEQPLHARYLPTALVQASYLTAVATRTDSFWIPDHLTSLLPRSIMTSENVGAARLIPKADAHLEPWTVLGHIAARHRRTRMRLGIGVTDAGRRNPAVTAQAAATLHILTRGRAILGMGTGARSSNEPYGVDWSQPVARFEESLATIRALWNSKGEPVTRDSRFFPLHRAVFDLPPYRGRWPDIWAGSRGPRMLRATGRYADGWYPDGMTLEPAQYAADLERVRAAAADAGRDPMSVVPACLFFTVTGRSSAEVDDALGSPALKSFALNASAHAWSRHGMCHPLGDGTPGAQRLAMSLLDEQTVLAATANVPPALLSECMLVGTPDDIVDQVAEWRDHGLRYAVIGNFSSVQVSARRAMLATIALSRALRGLRTL
jgi:phthiodiolone/phenolphthiodiolone dimycocerosates ketoreductase